MRGEIRASHKLICESVASSDWATRATENDGTGGGIRTHTV